MEEKPHLNHRELEGSGCTCTYYCTQTNDVFNMDRKWPSEMEGERKEGKKGGSRKKCCSVMTRWTPGAEWDTWFPWPRHASEAYSVHVCVPSCPLDEHQLHTQTQPLTHICTCMHVIGTTPHSYWCSEVAKALRKQTATGDVMSTPCTQSKFAPPPFFSLFYLSVTKSLGSVYLSLFMRVQQKSQRDAVNFVHIEKTREETKREALCYLVYLKQ